MIIYSHLTVCQRIVQWRGTVWHDVAVHFVLTTVVTLLVHQLFYAERLLGLPPFVGGPALEEPRAQVSDLAWRVFMFPLSFLLALRSNQAFKRYLEGISYYTDLNCSITELCRQTTYIRTAEGSFDLPEPGTQPREGQASCDDEAKQRIIRHCVAFATATRQDIRNLRLPPTQSHEELEALRLHVTDTELKFLHEQNVHDEDINTPLIVARWLTHDLAMVLDRVSPPTLIPSEPRAACPQLFSAAVYLTSLLLGISDGRQHRQDGDGVSRHHENLHPSNPLAVHAPRAAVLDVLGLQPAYLPRPDL